MMTITPMKRLFEFQGIRLPDPNSAMTVEQVVRGVFAT
jgi:PRTRC genetic system protein C